MITDKKHVIAIAGAGGIGRAVGLILAEYSLFEPEIFIGDLSLETAENAASWINFGNTRLRQAKAFHLSPDYEETSENVFQSADIILDCLPGTEAPRMGAIAKANGCHYVNLTEYVNETAKLKDLAKDASTGFILQTGLAPGFVNVLANSLYGEFVQKYQNQTVEYIGMKVGALTEYAEGPHFYGFTWSPVGVATEYLKDALIIEDYKKKSVHSLSAPGSLIIHGVRYEENYTSGGAADLPDAFEGLARKLDYKTLRYPGHYDWVKSLLDQTPANEEPVHYLEKTMLSTIPATEDDIVIVYCSVKGFDHTGYLRSIEKSFKVGPTKVGNVTLRAIQATTAAPMAQCAAMLLSGKYKGAVLQSQIDPQEFLNGNFVKPVYFPQQANHSGRSGEEITVAA